MSNLDQTITAPVLWTRGVHPMNGPFWSYDQLNNGSSSSLLSLSGGSNVPPLFGGGSNVPPLFGGGSNVPPLFGGGSNVPSLFGGTSLRLPQFCGAGYVPDHSDQRDHMITPGVNSPRAKSLVNHFRILGKTHFAAWCRTGKPTCQPAFDLRGSNGDPFGPIDHQGPVQSCTAHAVTSLAEYWLKHQRQRPGHELSRLFNYKVARSLLGLRGDTGATLRDAIKGLSRYGCPKEACWPYDLNHLEREPGIVDLEAAHSFKGWKYARLDDYKGNGEQTLGNVLHALADQIPVAFGFSVGEGVVDVDASNPEIPLLTEGDRVTGRHAVLAVGYDQNYEVGRLGSSKRKMNGRRAIKAGKGNRGALLIRNSWGTGWGIGGYGWLPFEYILNQLAMDFWILYR